MSKHADTAPAELWVVPLNDLEAQEIVHLLDEQHRRVLISYQRWGATWAGLEKEIREFIIERLGDGSVQVIGVELGGANPYGAINIDHHRYRDDDRFRVDASIEQIAERLGIGLRRRQKLIGVNDRAWIPGLRREFPGISDPELTSLRREDRRIQGVTVNDEKQARADMAKARFEQRRCTVSSDHRATSALFDFLLLETDTNEILAMSPDLWQYTGPRVGLFSGLEWGENHWSGGETGSGYFCLERPSAEDQARMTQTFDSA